MTTLPNVETPFSSQLQQAQPGSQTHTGYVNVGSRERFLTGGAGALLALYGLRRLGIRGLAGLGLGAMLLRRAISGHCAAYESLGISTAKEPSPEEYFDYGIHIEESITINKSPGELYQFWRNFENLPQFLEHLESVRSLDHNRSHWVARGPADLRIEWDAEVINDEPDHLISWKSLSGASVDSAGTVLFEPAAGGIGTDVRVVLDYIPPGGRLGSWFAKLFGRDADQLIRKDLAQLKKIMEGADRLRV